MRRWKSSNPQLQRTFELMLQVGDTRAPNMGGLSNAYCTARDTGLMPSWCIPGTPSYAAAKAGLYRRATKED